MTTYQAQYNKQISKIAIIFMVFHLPVFAFMAWWFRTEQAIALGLSSFILLAPVISYFKSKTNRTTLNLAAFGLICYSAIMIHLGRGMIEFHFHIFVMMALFALTGSMVPVLIGALTAATHHLVFYILFPASVFNYNASFGIVLLHATFVILETIGCLYLAKRFGEVLEIQGSTALSLKDVVEKHIQISDDLNETSSTFSKVNQTQVDTAKHALKTLEEISLAAKESSMSAEQSIQQAESSFHALEQGQKQLSSMSESLADIQKTQNIMAEHMDESSQQMTEFLKVINDISNKINMINEIVFQTKLLSFNASIEAARAGEAGKGFAVVAHEVGNLAQMSGKAAREIETLVRDSVQMITNATQNLVEKSAQISKDSHERIQKSLTVSTTAIASLNDSIQSSRQLKTLMQQIYESGESQKQGVEALKQAMSRFDEVSNESNAIATSNRSQAQRLIADTDTLKSLVERISKKAA